MRTKIGLRRGTQLTALIVAGLCSSLSFGSNPFLPPSERQSKEVIEEPEPAPPPQESAPAVDCELPSYEDLVNATSQRDPGLVTLHDGTEVHEDALGEWTREDLEMSTYVATINGVAVYMHRVKRIYLYIDLDKLPK